jgi:hypothetical protein
MGCVPVHYPINRNKSQPSRLRARNPAPERDSQQLAPQGEQVWRGLDTLHHILINSMQRPTDGALAIFATAERAKLLLNFRELFANEKRLLNNGRQSLVHLILHERRAP